MDQALRSESAYRARLEALGANAAWTKWRGMNRPAEILCPEGHKAAPKPAVVRDHVPCSQCAYVNTARHQPHRTGALREVREVAARGIWSVKAASEARYRARLAELGATPAWDEWHGVGKPHRVVCREGHERTPTPSRVLAGGGVCRVCAGLDPVTTEAKCKDLLLAMGARPAWEKWEGVQKKHRVICAAGHECWPAPARILRGGGPCRTCAGKDPKAAEARLREKLLKMGYTPAWDEWRGSRGRHRAICPQGHECWANLHSVDGGTIPCGICTLRDPAAAEADFRRRLEVLGVTPAWEKWKGVHKTHECVCSQGHTCHPRPDHIRNGVGPCRACAGLDPATAEANFRKRLTELGATPLFEKWEGSGTPHKARCKEGHICWPRPGHVQQGRGPCATCAGKNPVATEAAYVARLAELGATPAWGLWLGTQIPHPVTCEKGHECWPRPAHVMAGSGACRVCSGRDWDTFYVTANDHLRRFKIGITSGDPRPRLARHRLHGYTRVMFTATGLADARDIERYAMAGLTALGHDAVQGLEHFSFDALPHLAAILREYGLEWDAAA